ncbi:MAG: hypothetical protein JST42_14290 [Bacteroidetes bacterium]|nr:hypothetical protein [Bacteroidota bacterium]
MKRSNQLLIALLLLALLVISFANLSLYSEYRKGHFTPRDQLMVANWNTAQLPPLHTVSLTGVVWANFIPSDSNYIEYPTVADKTTGNYVRELHRSGDTLYISGPYGMPNHRVWADWVYRHSFAPINIYLEDLRSIDITNSQIYVAGKPAPAHKTTHISANGSSIWIGEYNESQKRQPLPKEYFDSLDLRLDNTLLLLNSPAVIRTLHARLDNFSEIGDRIATLGSADISPGPDSRVSITGTNIPKTTINVH